MKTKNPSPKRNLGRRSFLLTAVPATCCLFSFRAFTQTEKDSEPVEHKFDNKIEKELSYRDQFNLRYQEFININKTFAEEIGEEKVIKVLMKQAEKNGENWAKWMLKNNESNGFSDFLSYLDNPYYDKTLNFEIVEKSERACEIKSNRMYLGRDL